ncbi:unnamed protein product [Ascophyllum nodosum]
MVRRRVKQPDQSTCTPADQPIVLCRNLPPNPGTSVPRTFPACATARYPFPWDTVSSFVLREKARGPPDDMVTLKVDRNTFKYEVRMPWYARLVLGKSITWHDVFEVDPEAKVLGEDGANVSLQRLGHVRDVSSWRACEHNPGVTVFKKRIEFKIRMPLGPTIMAQVAQPLIKWFKSKSQLCRENEVKAIRQFLEKAKEETEEERNARIEEDIAWIAALRVENLSMVYALDREE